MTRTTLFLLASSALSFIFAGTVTAEDSYITTLKTGTASQVREVVRGKDLNSLNIWSEDPLSGKRTQLSSLMLVVGYNRDAGATEALLQAGARPDLPSSDGSTALLVAARSNPNPAVTSALLKYGATIDQRDAQNRTPLMLSMSNRGPVTRVLLQGGANPLLRDSNGSMALHMIETYTPFDSIKALLDAGVNPNLRDSQGKLPFLSANLIRRDDWEKVLDLFLSTGANLNLQAGTANEGWSLLMIVSRAGMPRLGMAPEKMRYLINHGCRIDSKSSDGTTALLALCADDFQEDAVALVLLQILLSSGAKTGDRDGKGRTALITAAEANKGGDFLSLLLKAGASLEETDALGRTALIAAASIKPDKPPRSYLALIDSGADIGAKGLDGRNSMEIIGGNSVMMANLSQFFLRRCQIAPLGEIKAWSAHYPFLTRDRSNKLLMLWALAMNPNLDVATSFFDSLSKGHPAWSTESTGDGTTLLIQAAAGNSNPAVVKFFLDRGADPDFTSSVGLTPLLAAAINPNPEILKMFLRDRKQLDSALFHGMTVLMIAAAQNPNPEVLRTILAAGAEKGVKNPTGLTAWDLAKTNTTLAAAPDFEKILAELKPSP